MNSAKEESEPLPDSTDEPVLLDANTQTNGAILMKTMSLMENKGPSKAGMGIPRLELHRSSKAARISRRAPVPKARTVLVPVDFTEASHRALDYALLLADCIDASIVLLHVVERTYAEGFLDAPPTKCSVRTEADRRAREKLDAVAESKSDRLVPIRRVVGHGVPEHEILRLVESMGVDLIVLGRRPRNPLSRLVFGSVTRTLVDTAPCPVVIVPELP